AAVGVGLHLVGGGAVTDGNAKSRYGSEGSHPDRVVHVRARLHLVLAYGLLHLDRPSRDEDHQMDPRLVVMERRLGLVASNRDGRAERLGAEGSYDKRDRHPRVSCKTVERADE